MFTLNLKRIYSSMMLLFVIAGSLQMLPKVNAFALRESECNSTTTAPTFNSYPINTNLPNPVTTDFDCKDMPLLSFFPISTQNNNPREINIIENQNITFQAYYNNSANPSTGQSVMDPNLAIKVNQINSKKFCITGTLSGSNTTSVTSANKGGDLCINTPEGTQLKIIANTVKHFPDAIERKDESDKTGRTPSDPILDNSVGTTISNPIYTSFPGTNLPSTAGLKIKDKLQPGFLNYGYVLAQIGVFVPKAETNRPPTIPGQEITIVRGQSGSFSPYAGTDPDGNIPLTYVTLDMPSFCKLDNTTNIVKCDSDAKTPIKSTFNVVPYDSKKLVGTSAPFIVNIIEADKAILATSLKSCKKLGTETDCKSAKLQPKDKVTYTIKVTNTGKTTAKNVKVVDDYDQALLKDIVPVKIEGINITDKDGFLTFTVGNLEPGVTKDLKYDATIKDDVKNGVIVVNTAEITADELPKHTVSTQFPVILPNNPLLEAEKLCVKYSTTIKCDEADLKPGEKVLYAINIKNTGATDAVNVKVVDDYDQEKLESITHVEKNPSSVSNPVNTITWDLGSIKAGQAQTIQYSAVIQSTVKNGEQIVNTANVTADNLPDIKLKTDFIVKLITVTKTSRTGGSTFLIVLLAAILIGGGYYYYKKNGKLGKNFLPKRSGKE
jgi:hypothetical protein